MKILFLHAEIMDYTLATVTELVKKNAAVHIVHHGRTRNSILAESSKLGKVFNLADLKEDGLTKLAVDLSPDITVTSGWSVPDYCRVARILRANGMKIACGIDNQWHGTYRQIAAAFACRLGYLSRTFTHAWTAGMPQYHLARALGFSQDNIISDLYSANTPLFAPCYNNRPAPAKTGHRRFLFVGRFVKSKGLLTLLPAWEIAKKNQPDISLKIIGEGPLDVLLKNNASKLKYKVLPFMSPRELANEALETDCLILPSTFEPWGVVVHEFAAAGAALICSKSVGSASHFTIHGLNGFIHKRNDVGSLANAINRVASLTDAELQSFSTASHLLSARISPQTSASNLLSISDKK